MSEELRELDAEVAVKVMGREVLYVAGNISDYTNPEGTHPATWVGTPCSLEECRAICDKWSGNPVLTPYPKGNPPYSTDRAAALEVVDKLFERDLRVEMSGNKQGWLVTIDNGNCENEVSAQAATLQEAICIAALKCVAAKQERDTERSAMAVETAHEVKY